MIKETLCDFLINENCSKRELARKMGIPNSQFATYFYDVPPKFDSAIKIANYFHCTLDYLFGVTDNLIETKKPIVLDRHSFINKYLNLLKANKVSHRAVCKEIDISDRNLSFWKKHNLPSTETVVKLAKHFCVSIDYLVGKTESSH